MMNKKDFLQTNRRINKSFATKVNNSTTDKQVLLSTIVLPSLIAVNYFIITK